MQPFARPSSTNRRLVPALLVIGALVAAGCGSGGGGSTADATTAAPASSVATTTTTIPITDVFSGLSSKTSTAAVKITYVLAQGTSATLAQDGRGNSSFLSAGNLLLSNGKTVIRCDGVTATAKCSDLGPTSSDDALTQIIASYAGLSTLHSTSLGTTSTQTIAGRSTSCVTFKASDYATAVGGTLPDASRLSAAATVTVCVDDDSGFALKIALSDRGQTVNEVLATQVSTPSPSDFVPPSVPVTVPELATTTTTPAG